MQKRSHADVALIRQRTQFTCCAASIASALHALGKRYSEDDVNMILEAGPMRGASWEAMLATVQYFGCRGSLVVPSTPRMLKDWTDAGKPVVIAWNPESRPWSHASTVFKVTEDDLGKLWVHVMDPNIPNPGETVRVLDEDKFSALWAEKVSESLIMRRPAMVITEEVNLSGRQMIASTKTAGDQPKRTMNVTANAVPIPKPIQKPPELWRKSLEEQWAHLFITIVDESRTDGGNDEVKLTMAVWDAGYQAGHVQARSPSHDYMVEGSRILGLMKHLGRLQEGIEEWTKGYTEGLKESTP